MSTYLITGGAGFIGSHLADALIARGHRVRVLDDLSSGKRDNLAPQAELVVGDIRDRAALSRAFEGVAGCFHLAAIASVQKSVENAAETSAVNGLGTVGVLHAAVEAGRVPVVFASSAAVYGDNDRLPLKETEYPRPLSPYAADKFGNEMQARALGASRGLPGFGLRFFNVYGPRQDPSSPYSGVVSIFRQRAMDRRELTIYGDGGQERDFIHVSDVVRFLMAAMERVDVSVPVVNVCTGRGATVLQLATHFAEMHGAATAFAPARAGDIQRSLGSPEAAQRLLGISATIDLKEGLATL